MNQGLAIEVIVVDNGSVDGSVERARSAYPFIRVVSDVANDGFAGGANRGAAVASREFLLFLNPDVILEPGCVQALLVDLTGSEGAAICSPIVVDGSTGVEEYGLTVDLAGDPAIVPLSNAPLYVSGCALATSRDTFAALGGFEGAFFMFCEDLDLCWRALLHGYNVRVVRAARARHRGGGSTPGGHVSGGRIEVTSFRIALRERNTMATLVRCGPLVWVLIIIPLRLMRIGALALAATVIGRPQLARALVAGVAWNVRRLPELVRQRTSIPTRSETRRRVFGGRVLRDITFVRMLFRHGIPRFVDGGPKP
jgi:GT2 family glycosyltransferase